MELSCDCERELVRGGSARVVKLRDEPLELGLDLLEPAGVGLERREERAQLGRRLAQPQLGVAQLGARSLELRRELLERRDRALGKRDEARSSLPVVRSE